MLQPKPQNPEEILRLLQAAAKRRRPVPAYVKLIFAAILLVLLGLVLWLYWPRGEPPRLEVAAVDQVTLPDRPVELQARLESADDSESQHLSGYPLYFGKYEVPQRADLKKATTDAAGIAAVSWPPPPASAHSWEFIVRYRGEGRQVAEDKGRIFTWPAEGTAVLIVDAPRALADEGEESWQKKNLFEIRPLPGAAAALQKAAKKSYKVVYFCSGVSNLRLYKKVRGWLQRKDLAAEQFPDGPALGRISSTEEGWERKTLETLGKQFRGKKFGVTRRPQTARLFQELGLTTFLVGDVVEPPPGVTRVKSWAELPGRLP
jgi:hypothetical protein